MQCLFKTSRCLAVGVDRCRPLGTEDGVVDRLGHIFRLHPFREMLCQFSGMIAQPPRVANLQSSRDLLVQDLAARPAEAVVERAVNEGMSESIASLGLVEHAGRDCLVQGV
jgi:hypothetical protein